MSDDDIFLLALDYGRIMERGNMTRENKIRATIVLTEASERARLEGSKEVYLTALQVLKFF